MTNGPKELYDLIDAVRLCAKRLSINSRYTPKCVKLLILALEKYDAQNH